MRVPPEHPSTYSTVVSHYLFHQQFEVCPGGARPRAAGYRPTLADLTRTTRLSRRTCCQMRAEYERTLRRLSRS